MWKIFRLSDPADEASVAVERAFAEQERQSHRLSMHVRTWALAAIALALLVSLPHAATLYYVGGIGAFIALAQWQGTLARRSVHRAWHGYAFAALNAVALAYMLLAPNPWWLTEIPSQMVLRPELFPYFYLLLAFAGLSFSPALVVWTALVSALSWSAGVALIASRPDSVLPVLTRVGERDSCSPPISTRISWICGGGSPR